MHVSGSRSRTAVIAVLVVLGVSAGVNAVSYGTAGNGATIHGSSGLYRRDYGGVGGGGGGGGGGGSGFVGRSGSSRYSSYGGYSPSSGSADEVQKETKYYYGGKYQGSCVTDGLYYRDDTTFIICSNGYPHEQPCPPGTKTSGSPRYQPGYYYGYTDLCSVNLVDYGYGPEYYAPRGYPYLSPDHRDRVAVAARPSRGGSAGGYGAQGRSVGAPVGSSAGGGFDRYLGSQGSRESAYGIGPLSKSRASLASDYSAGSGSSSSSNEGLSSAYQRESSPSRLTYHDAKAPYDGAARSNYYGSAPSYGGYDASYGSRDSLYSASAAGKHYN